MPGRLKGSGQSEGERARSVAAWAGYNLCSCPAGPRPAPAPGGANLSRPGEHFRHRGIPGGVRLLADPLCGREGG